MLLLASCRLFGMLVDDPVGVVEGLGEASGSLVHVSCPAWVRHVPGSSFLALPRPSGRQTRLALPKELEDLHVHLVGPLDEDEVARSFEDAQPRVRYGLGQGAGVGGRHVAVL
jgi:hypothetical protein